MKTFILEWNPATSPMTEDDFLRGISCLEWGDFRLPLPEGSPVRSGDNFYILRAGTTSDGIVGKGFFLSAPDELPRKGFFIKVRPTFMVSWEHPKGMLSIETLKHSLQSLTVGDMNSCLELSSEDTTILSSLWDEYLSRFCEEDFKGSGSAGLVGRTERPEAILDDAVLAASDALYDLIDEEGNPLILRPMKLAASWETLRYKALSFLFYAAQYSELDAGKVREKGFPEDYADTIGALQPPPEMGTREYIQHLVRQNNMRASKIAVRDMELNHRAWLFKHEFDASVNALCQSAGIEREF